MFIAYRYNCTILVVWNFSRCFSHILGEAELSDIS